MRTVLLTDYGNRAGVQIDGVLGLVSQRVRPSFIWVILVKMASRPRTEIFFWLLSKAG
jgi:hypothetical protein